VARFCSLLSGAAERRIVAAIRVRSVVAYGVVERVAIRMQHAEGKGNAESHVCQQVRCEMLPESPGAVRAINKETSRFLALMTLYRPTPANRSEARMPDSTSLHSSMRWQKRLYGLSEGYFR
jgi:hypothetical protein